MGAKAKKIGGSKGGQGVSDKYTSAIQALLGGDAQSGYLGAGRPAGEGAMRQGQGAADIYSSLLSGGAGEIGGAIQQLLQRTQDRDVMKMKEAGRASGGAQFGTPGQYAEAMYRGEAAPNITAAIGKLQMDAARDIFGMSKDIYGRETPQAEMMIEPGVFDKIMQGVGAIAPAAAQFLAPGLGPAMSIGATAMEQINSTKPTNVTKVTTG
jgi:hypothetical protein